MAIDYDAYYRPKPGDERWDGWRALGARNKAEHVDTLLERASAQPGALLEVGCGDGTVLAELAKRRSWQRLVAVDVAEAAVDAARLQPGVTEALRFDGWTLPFADAAFPLVLATHVLEHVEAPGRLLGELRRVSSELVIVEVPLERNLLARRPAARALSRAAGHIQRFGRRDLRRLLLDAGLTPVADLLDPLPRDAQVFREGTIKGTVKWAARAITARSPLADRLMTLHYAILARK